jgi:hypothetical protein
MLYNFTITVEIEPRPIFRSLAELMLLVIFLLLLRRYYKGLYAGFLF